jgi:hypothetical protein
MTAAECGRLARILGMLGSEHAGERAAAALQAEAFRKRHGLTWEAMLSVPPVAAVREPRPARPEPPPPVDPAQEAARRQAAEDLAAAQAKWAREDAARKATWRAEQAEKAAREAEPPPRFDPPLPWVPPRPPRPLPFERIWRPKLEMAMSPRGLFFAIVGVWIISIAGVIAEKF